MSKPFRYYDNSARTRLMIRGADRAKFLHNLTTNEVKRLKPGEGREAFVTSPQGKTLAAIQYHILPEAILVRLDPDCREACLAHFNKYGVFDEVTIEDLSTQFGEWVVTSLSPDSVLERLQATLPSAAQSIIEAEGPLWMIQDDPTGQAGVTLVASSETIASLGVSLGSKISEAEYEALRIQAGRPVFGADVTPSNLPQEVGRDSLAINFVKGCYLGQETVARLDALGHVNKLLRGAQSGPGADCPPRGAVLKHGGVDVGTVTSSSRLLGEDRVVALVFVKVPKVSVGDDIVAEWEGGTATLKVVELPFPGR